MTTTNAKHIKMQHELIDKNGHFHVAYNVLLETSFELFEDIMK
jgi:hypothetical protein